MIKLIWILTGINVAGLIFFLAFFAMDAADRKVDAIESGWVWVLVIVAVVVILLGVIPPRISQSSFSMFFALFFAVMPSVIAVSVLIVKKIPTNKKTETFATTYYKDKTQWAIATAIEKGDTILLEQLIKGQDLNIQGKRVWDWDGLSYLQFAVRLRSNSYFFPFNEAANNAAIKMLVAHGAKTTPALAEGAKYLSIEMITFLLENGADPNTSGFASADPLIFELIGSEKKFNDVAILLLQHGGGKDAKNKDFFTPVMYAAYNADSKPAWIDCWRLVRYLLEDAHADYHYATADGKNLTEIIRTIKADAATEKIAMPADFDAVVKWLHEYQPNYESMRSK